MLMIYFQISFIPYNKAIEKCLLFYVLKLVKKNGKKVKNIFFIHIILNEGIVACWQT